MSGAKLILVFGPAAIAAVTGFTIAFYIRRMLKIIYTSKFQSALIFVIMISIGVGLTGIINEVLNFPIHGLKIRNEKIVQWVIANLVFIPLVCWVIVLMVDKKQTPVDQRAEEEALIKFKPRDSESQGVRALSMEAAYSNIPPKGSGGMVAVLHDVSGGEDSRESSSEYLSDEQVNSLYAAALEEIESKQIDKGLWARSFAHSNGDEKRAEAKYIEARFEVLKANMLKDMFGASQALKYREIERKADNGDVAALYELAQLNYDGDFIGKKDVSLAFKLMREAAFLGSGKAQHRLSSMYWKGHGVIANRSYAYAWASIAAQEIHDAKNNLSFF